MLKAEQLTAGYGKTEILHHLSLTVERGKITAVIGQNGSGKSTLLKALAGILPPTSGTVSVDGTPSLFLSRKDRAKKIAYLPQGHLVPRMTVGQMVLHGRFPHTAYPHRYSEADRSAAEEAMERMGIAHLAHRPLSALSGGMRQNAYIAMALAQDAAYILLDEPTTYLDIPHQIELTKTLRGLAEEGRGIAVVMHDLPMAFTCSDEIAVIKDGAVLLRGTPRALWNREEMEALFGTTLAYDAEEGQYYCRLRPISP